MTDNYEQKYNQALERAKAVKETYHNLGNISAIAVLESIFPELKGENERIKRCIGMCLTDATEQRFEDFNITLTDCLAWLEKQGEQKPIEQDTETHDLWVYIREWNDKFGRLPKDEDELASCIDYVMKRQKPADKVDYELESALKDYGTQSAMDFDWQSFRAEAAKNILCAMIQGGYGQDRIEHQSELSVKYADELIKQLKEKDEK